MPRRAIRPRIVVALVAAGVLASSIVFSSAGSLGGVQTDQLGAASGDTQHVSAVQLEWNRDAGERPTRPSSLRLTAADGEAFEQGDVVDVTAAGAGEDTCSASATVADRVTTVDLIFPACGVMLWDLSGVAVNISGSGGATTLRSNVGGMQGTLASFDGAVVEPDGSAIADHTTARQSGVERLTALRLGVGDATAERLVGRRLVAVLVPAASEPTRYVGVIGTIASNEGIWVEADPQTSGVTVVVDLARLAGGTAPRVSDVARYQLVLLQPQLLGAGQSPANQYAITTAGGVVKGTATDPVPTPTPTPVPSPSPSSSPTPVPVGVASAVEPVGLDPRLKVKGKYTQRQDESTLRFCYEFDISNTSKDSIEWGMTFDTAKPPMWGLDPTVVNGNGVGTLHSKFGLESINYAPPAGLWSIGGVDYNKVLRAGDSTTVGYCARPVVPAADTTLFEEPEVSLSSGKDKYYVEFRVKVRSSSEYLVPWETEIDFADHVCPASLPATLRGQNAVLTKIDGTRYRLRGGDNTYRFVSTDKKQDFVFLGFSPVSDPFAADCT